MRELTYFVAVSIDGRIAGPGDDFSAFPLEGDHIDMIMRDYRDTVPAIGLEAMGLTADASRFDTVLMGWNTYAAGFPHDVYSPYPHLRQIVFSRQEREAPDEIEVTSSDPVEAVRSLKAQDGTGIWLCGGGVLASALADEIDRMVLKVNPVVLGDGTPLFAGPYEARGFGLEESTRYESGVVINEYGRG